MIDENANPLELDCNGVRGISAFALTDYIFAFYKKVPGKVCCRAGLKAHVALRVFGIAEYMGWFFDNHKPNQIMTPYGDAEFCRDRTIDDSEAGFFEVGPNKNVLILKNLECVLA